MTSHSKKKYDRKHKRNFYAKELEDAKYRPRVVQEARVPKPSRKQLEKELEKELEIEKD